MNILNKALTGVSIMAMSLVSTHAQAQTYNVESVSAIGSTSSRPAQNVIDGNEKTRWRGNSRNPQEQLILDLGSPQMVDNVRIDWWRGRFRTHNFEIAGRSGTSGSWTTIFSGTAARNDDLQDYDVSDINARQIRILSNRRAATEIARVEIIGPAGPGAALPSTPEPTPPPAPLPSNVDIVAADSANRSNTSNLNGQTVEGDIFVLVTDNNVDRVQFFIDNDFVKTEHTAPFDLQGGPSFGANAFDTTELSNGVHTLRAEVLFNNGATDTVSANFTVSNSDADFGLNPSLEPWENFDLDDWALDSPEGRSNNPCQSRRVDEDEWNEVPGTPTHDYIFTHTDGGMRFVSPIGGSTTNPSCNEGFPRSELREMLRRGNTSISTTGVNPNNWALGYQPSGGNYGGRNGELKATLRVNRVTTTGTNSLHPGRTIIGQIHAEDDEPLRLYYRKLPNAEFGCIYAESEIRNGDDVTFNMIGDEQCDDNNGNGPSDGIVLDELFSYEIENVNEEIRVRVIRGDQDGEVLSEVTIDLDALDSGYDRSDEWMYFKAGAYTQNNTGNDNDTDVITFYRLSNTHDDN